MQDDFTPAAAMPAQTRVAHPLHAVTDMGWQIADMMVSVLEYNADAALHQVHNDCFATGETGIFGEVDFQTIRSEANLGLNMLIFYNDRHGEPLSALHHSNAGMVRKVLTRGKYIFAAHKNLGVKKAGYPRPL